MTLEGEGPGADETPAPPARTRWSEDAADDELGIMPPYVPGGRTPAAARPEQPEPEQPPPEQPPLESAPEPPAPSPGAAVPDHGSGFPFGGPADEPAHLPGLPVPESPAAEQGPEAGEQGTGEFPFGAFEIEPDGEEGAGEPWSAEQGSTEAGSGEPAFGMPFAEAPAAPASSDDLADRLERLADALRRDGRAAVERELGSGDRLTSLLAGVVAGYLAGLDG